VIDIRLALYGSAALALALCGGITNAAAKSHPIAVAYHIDPAHDGTIKMPASFTGPLPMRWMHEFEGMVSYPVIVNGIVFVTVANPVAYGTQLYALNLRTGEVLWQRPINGTYYWSSAAYDKGRLFVVNFDGLVQAFSADNVGTQLWASQMPDEWAFSAPLTAYNGQVFVAGAGDAGELYAVDEATGHVNWKTLVANGAYSSPAIGDGNVYVTYDCNYYRFNVRGILFWYTYLGCGGGGGNTPAYYQNRLYVRDMALNKVVLNADTGAIIGPLASIEPPAFWQDGSGNKYQLDLIDQTLTAIDPDTGTERWSFSGDKTLSSAPIIVNGTAIIGSGFGNLYLLDAATGKQLWSTQLGEPVAPSVRDGLPTTGIAAGLNTLVVPASYRLIAFAGKN